MFITTKRHKKIVKSLQGRLDMCRDLLADKNNLVRVQREMIAEYKKYVSHIESSQPSNLDDKDLKRLMALCHPDKHGGSQVANDMFIKINNIRKH